MSRKTNNSAFNKSVHDSDTDSEHSLDAEHAALAKMAESPQSVQGVPPLAPIATTPPIAPITHTGAPGGALGVPAPHPFQGILNAIRRPKAPTPIRIASPKSKI